MFNFWMGFLAGILFTCAIAYTAFFMGGLEREKYDKGIVSSTSDSSVLVAGLGHTKSL